MTRTRSRPAPAAAEGPSDPWEARGTRGALLLLALLLAQGVVFITASSQTSDEAAHLAAGYSYLTTGDFRLNVEHPPLLKELAALPLLPLDLSFPWGPLWEQAEEWNLGRIFVHENRVSNDTLLFLARLPILGLSLLLGWTIFIWGRRLFGARGALLGLALYVLDPNVVAHSGLVTTDLGITLFIFLTIHALWRWSDRPTPSRLLLVGLCAGAAFASKFTALWLLPMLLPLLLLLLLDGTLLPRRPWSSVSPMAGKDAGFFARAGALALAASFVVVLAVLVVTVTYAGRGLPAFARGLTLGLSHSGKGHMAYLMGEYSETGWWYYFLYAFLVKTPVGTLLVVGLALGALLFGRRIRLTDELFLWVPILVTIGLTCLWKVDIGLRHLLPIYPFLYLATGRLVASARPRSEPGASSTAGRRAARGLGLVAAIALAGDAFEAVRIAPDHLAYFNVLVGGPENGHRYLLDSNLDWGQSSKALRSFMVSERIPTIYCAFTGNSDPWYYGVNYQYVQGTGNLDAAKRRPVRMPEGAPRELFAISPMVLHAVHITDHHLYDWLLQRQPVAQPGRTYLVYDITRDAESHAMIAVISVNFGLLELAEFEARRTLTLDPGNALAKAVLEEIVKHAARPPAR